MDIKKADIRAFALVMTAINIHCYFCQIRIQMTFLLTKYLWVSHCKQNGLYLYLARYKQRSSKSQNLENFSGSWEIPNISKFTAKCWENLDTLGNIKIFGFFRMLKHLLRCQDFFNSKILRKSRDLKKFQRSRLLHEQGYSVYTYQAVQLLDKLFHEVKKAIR